MSQMPSISIVVPNYHNAATLGPALQSLVDQQYPRLEILVVDGGSTDGSVDIIRRFEPHLAWWVSEADRGQSHAINKGLARATGEVVNWLCSDDRLEPGALETVGRAFAADWDLDVLAGACRYQRPDGETWTDTPSRDAIDTLPAAVPVSQPSCFWRRASLDRDPPLDESLHYTMDWELWAYLHAIGARWRTIDDVLSVCNVTDTRKTDSGGDAVVDEIERVYRRYRHERVPLTFWYRRLLYPLDKWRSRGAGQVRVTTARALKFALRCLLVPFYGYRMAGAMNWSFHAHVAERQGGDA